MDKLSFIGRLGADPKGEHTPEGQFVAHFSVAVNRKKDKEPIWFRVTAWDKLGENCHQYLKKGRRVYIEGRLAYDEATGGPAVFKRQDGAAGASFEVTAAFVEFLDGPQTEGPAESTE